MTESRQSAGVPASPSGHSRAEPEEVSALRASVPNAVTNHDLTIGIVSPYGEMWTWEAFGTAKEAEEHLREFWGKDADEYVPAFKLCMVSVEVVPQSEPFPLPSASAIEARSAETGNTDSARQGESAVAKPDAPVQP